MQKFIEKFEEKVKPEKTKVKDKLSFIWLFGAGADDITLFESIKSDLSPSHKYFSDTSLSIGLSSQRSKFYQWLLHKHKEEVDTYRVPEQFQEWYNIDSGYTNLVDFELDLALISKCIVIFSESVGAHMEIGLFSSYPEIQKTSLIIAPKKHTSNKPSSFYYLGPIKKFKENQLNDSVSNVYVLDDDLKDGALLSEFDEIKKQIEEIITSPSNKKQDFEPENRGHIILLTIEILSLFNKLNSLQLGKLLKFFKVKADRKSVIKILQGLETLKIVTSEMERSTEIFQLDKYYEHNICFDFSGDSTNVFDRTSFKIEMKEKNK